MRWFAYIIVVLFILTMIIIIWAYFIPDKINSPKARKRDLYKALGLSSPRKVNNFETNNISPPRPFGYKITWLAFKNPNRARLIREFKPEKNKAFNTNWELGIEGCIACTLQTEKRAASKRDDANNND